MTHFNQENTSGYTQNQLNAANEIITDIYGERSPLGFVTGGDEIQDYYKTDCERVLLAMENAETVTMDYSNRVTNDGTVEFTGTTDFNSPMLFDGGYTITTLALFDVAELEVCYDLDGLNWDDAEYTYQIS